MKLLTGCIYNDNKNYWAILRITKNSTTVHRYKVDEIGKRLLPLKDFGISNSVQVSAEPHTNTGIDLPKEWNFLKRMDKDYLE